MISLTWQLDGYRQFPYLRTNVTLVSPLGLEDRPLVGSEVKPTGGPHQALLSELGSWVLLVMIGMNQQMILKISRPISWARQVTLPSKCTIELYNSEGTERQGHWPLILVITLAINVNVDHKGKGQTCLCQFVPVQTKIIQNQTFCRKQTWLVKGVYLPMSFRTRPDNAAEQLVCQTLSHLMAVFVKHFQ